MPQKDKCELCGKVIAKDPVPYYQGKVQDHQNRMWRHEECPGRKPHKLPEEAQAEVL
jgi:hypothetical protein